MKFKYPDWFPKIQRIVKNGYIDEFVKDIYDQLDDKSTLRSEVLRKIKDISGLGSTRLTSMECDSNLPPQLCFIDSDGIFLYLNEDDRNALNAVARAIWNLELSDSGYLKGDAFDNKNHYSDVRINLRAFGISDDEYDFMVSLSDVNPKRVIIMLSDGRVIRIPEEMSIVDGEPFGNDVLEYIVTTIKNKIYTML